MAMRDKMRQNVSSFLQPGEVIQTIFAAQTTSPYFALISIWIVVLKGSYRVVVVTDRRILVCQAGRLSPARSKAVIAELPRATRIGPAMGLSYRCENLGERIYIAKQFHKDVRTADEFLDRAPDAGPG